MAENKWITGVITLLMVVKTPFITVFWAHLVGPVPKRLSKAEDLKVEISLPKTRDLQMAGGHLPSPEKLENEQLSIAIIK